MLDTRGPVVEFGLNVAPLLRVSDPILDEVPELESKRVSRIVQVLRTGPEEIADALGFQLLRNLGLKCAREVGFCRHLHVRRSR